MILVELALGLFALAAVVFAIIKIADRLGIIKTVKSWFKKDE
jgi:hypothetical protein